MNLTIAQRLRLRTTLVNSFDVKRLTGVILVAVGRYPEKLGISVDVVTTMVTDLIVYLDESSEWDNFFTAARVYENASPALIALCDEMPNLMADPAAGPAVPAGEDPVREVLLSNRVPFANRDHVRTVIVDMGLDAGCRGLVVNGPQRVGKSYCRLWINHMRQAKWPKDRVVHVLLREEARTDMSALTLARRVQSQLGLSSAGPGQPFPGEAVGQNEDAWAIDLAGWIARAVEASDTRAWIVLDGFDDPAVPDPTHRLIKQLAQHAADLTRLRLVLLGYSRELPEDTNVLFERLTLTYLTPDELDAMISRVATRWDCTAKAHLCAEPMAALNRLVQRYRALGTGVRTLHDALEVALASLLRALFNACHPPGGS